MPRTVLILLMAFLALMLAFAAAAMTPLFSPALAGKLQCPAGTTVQVSEYHATWTQPGETGIAVACVNAQGEVQKDRAREVRGFWLLVGIFWVPAFIVLLLVAWGIEALRRRQRARWERAGIDWQRYRRM